MKRLLVNFSEAVFLAQPPPRDIHKFAEEYFTRLWNRAKINMPSIGTEVGGGLSDYCRFASLGIPIEGADIVSAQLLWCGVGVCH